MHRQTRNFLLLLAGLHVLLWVVSVDAFATPRGAARHYYDWNVDVFASSRTYRLSRSAATIRLSATRDNSGTTRSTTVLPPEITTKALAQVYPAMVAHQAKFGNPNIPVGTVEGRQCNTIRGMHIQGKLTPAEVTLLEDMGFIFRALEDVYHDVDFEELFVRLARYKIDHDGDLDIKKKFAPDPELGAWVTGIRRLGKNGISKEHAQRLDEVGFVWVSSRKCGGKFMQQYRAIQKRLENDNGESDTVLTDPDVTKFIRAQKEAYRRNVLSEARVEYMARLLGEEWWNI